MTGRVALIPENSSKPFVENVYHQISNFGDVVHKDLEALAKKFVLAKDNSLFKPLCSVEYLFPIWDIMGVHAYHYKPPKTPIIYKFLQSHEFLQIISPLLVIPKVSPYTPMLPENPKYKDYGFLSCRDMASCSDWLKCADPAVVTGVDK